MRVGWVMVTVSLSAVSGCRPYIPAAADAAGAPRSPPPGEFRTPPPSTPPDESSALAVARQFASAIAAGDQEVAASMIHAPTGSHRRLADAVVRLFVAYHRVRTAAAARLGPERANELAMLDAGTTFLHRMRARLEGQGAVVSWQADDAKEEGATIDLVYADGWWRVALKSFIHGGDPPSASEVLDSIGEVSWFTRHLNEVAAAIERGELTDFEEINRAV